MQEQLQRPISLDENGTFVVEESISEYIGVDVEPLQTVSVQPMRIVSGVLFLIPKIREGTRIKVTNILWPERKYWQSEVWRRGYILPRPFYEKRRAKAQKKAAAIASNLVITETEEVHQ